GNPAAAAGGSNPAASGSGPRYRRCRPDSGPQPGRGACGGAPGTAAASPDPHHERCNAVNRRGGSDGEMSSCPTPPQGGIPLIGDTVFEALLAANLTPPDAPAELRALAGAIAALNVAPAGHELAGEPAARAAYRGGFGRAARSARAHRRRHRVLGIILSAKLAAAAAVAAGALTGAAYANALPAPVQGLAHHTLGAPAPHPATPPGQPGIPPGPRPAAPDAQGLCNAWAHARADGQAREEAVAFRDLAAAAGGAARVTAYCAAPRPGTAPSGQQVSHARGKRPSSSSTPAVHPTGQPASHPDHPSHPAHPSHPGAKPATHH
ncbi:MAG: hypothetical protein JWL68_4311, partial [Actinomycetia bacterium]|nr:hypothetical protein [Actinomycetes bacterium]